jgi:hypothetical protein
MGVDLMSYQRAAKAHYRAILNRPKRDRSAQLGLKRLRQQRHCGTDSELPRNTPMDAKKEQGGHSVFALFRVISGQLFLFRYNACSFGGRAIAPQSRG